RKTSIESIPNGLQLPEGPRFREWKSRNSSFGWLDGAGRNLGSSSGKIQRRQKTGCLGQRLLVFGFGIGIGHDARADVEMRAAITADRRPDGDAQLAFAVEAEIANRAAVRSTRNGFQFVNDFH